jgi:hypothetical protein
MTSHERRRECLVSRHSSTLSRDIVHTSAEDGSTSSSGGSMSRARRAGAEVTATSGEPEPVPDAREEEIVELRKHLAEEGLDAGAHTIAFHLEHRGMSGDTWGTCPETSQKRAGRESNPQPSDP